MNGKATGWAAAAAAAIAGIGGFAVQEDNNDLALEAIRQQNALLRECLIQLANHTDHS